MGHQSNVAALLDLPREQDTLIPFQIGPNNLLRVYPRSAHRIDGTLFFIGRIGQEKSLFTLAQRPQRAHSQGLQGGEPLELYGEADWSLTRYPLSHANALVLQQLFPFTCPVLLGVQDAIGLGDRLGLANAGHLRAVRGSRLRPVLAQQSIRELQRTEREPEDVMDAAVWAVFQEGYHEGFGADADHLKTPQDIDRMVRAGFTMFTFDPGEHVVNQADDYAPQRLQEQAKKMADSLPESDLEQTTLRYAGQSIRLGGDLMLEPDRMQVFRALVKYGRVIAHAVQLYRYLKARYPGHPAEVELSVDETEAVTTPFEHYFVVAELKRCGVALVSLAPRFVGRFEKGIDYIGDLDLFVAEYKKHLAIAERLGPYKISIHSGSDKFSIYQAIAAINRGHVHIKTAGTSYLEALKTVAAVQPELFHEILGFAREHYQTEKRTYHVSADLSKVPAASRGRSDELPQLFAQTDARQVLHVTFGRVLTDRLPDGRYRFRDRIFACLEAHEELHYHNLQQHLGRHISPFDRS